MSRVEVVPANRKGGFVLLCDDFRYVRNKTGRDNLTWRCSEVGCGAYAHTNFFDVTDKNPIIIVRRVDIHNHAPDEFNARRGRLLKNIQDRIQKNPTAPVRRIYDKAADNVSDSDALPGFENIRTRAKRYRAGFMPPIPRDVDDVVVGGEWRNTWHGRSFLLHQDNEWGVLIFSTTEMLKVLPNCDCLYVDGTFRTAPRPYEQLVTIHGSKGGFVIPLVFCLLTGKSIGQYRQLFQAVKRSVWQVTRRRLRPRRFVSDFESSLMIAIETEFPRCRVSGCYFHFVQSLWRHVQHLGLVVPYRQNSDVKKLIRLVMGIGFLPVLLVRQNFVLLCQRRRTRRLVRRFPELQDWLSYVSDTYVSNNASFPAPVWNVYDRNVDNRTNNHVEGFHSRWNSRVGVRHPNLWIFCRKLKDEERHVNRVIRAADRGDAPPSRKRAYRELQRRVERLKAEYVAGNRSLASYWHAIAHVVHGFD